MANDAPSAPDEPTNKPVPLGSDEDLGGLKPDYLPPGHVVNGYTIVTKRGKGGFGAVYMAQREGEYYALKFPLVLPESISQADRDVALGRLNREIGTLLQLSHPNIIQVIETWRWPSPKSGFPVIVMPFIRGVPVRQFVKKTVPSMAHYFAKILRPLADALAYIHRKNVIHRDIKSDNILVTAESEVLLLDFGISRSQAAATVTQGVPFMGTYTHIPPEVFAHIQSGGIERGDLSPYTALGDIYALGVVAYESFTGVIPRWYLSPETSPGGSIPVEWYDKLLQTEIDDPSDLNPNIPPPVSAFLKRMLATQTTERFPSALAMREAIDELLSAHAEDPAWTCPFTVPQGVQRPPPSSPSDKPTASGRAPKSGPVAAPPSARQSAPRAVSAVTGPPLVARRSLPPPPPPPSVPADLSFHAPGGAPPASFVTPGQPLIRDTVRALPEAAPAEDLAASLRRTQAQVQATQPKPQGFRLLLLGAVAAVVLVGVLVAAGPHSPAPKSLLATVDAPATATPVSPAPVPSPALPDREELAPPPAAAAVSPEAAAPEPAAHPRQPAPRPAAAPARSVDARDIDEELARNYGGARPVVPGADGQAPVVLPVKPAGPAWLKTAESASPSAAPLAGGIGVSLGAELPLRLIKPLDSRTIASGPAVARLQRPYAPRGDVLLASGTMLYGTASATGAGRFNIHFTRLKLADGREVVIDALAMDVQDKKPGLRASGRITQSGQQGPGVGAQVVKTAAGMALGQVPATDGVTTVAKGVAQTTLSSAGEGGAPGGGTGDALLLDAPYDFTLFVTQAF